ncbi:creatininase [Paeniglutamicibacter psychrophenolicus]|uniref:Creatinine amidohydrolase n=1 Tax=Paeniglutamicibacter psychrophenolicus TaxID=257454 RepID=A0ABS4WJE6_9MICC|nr:creatininase [Paeniglutamicibacter psychrophenolicus]MBP2376263.1 creatinine amidohydrolase [Paeniglutamicibacter psychrophenolicus]
MQSVYLEDIDAETYAAYVSQPHATVIIPAGATEQHGPHMPLGVDAMLSRAISGAVAEKLGALVAPTLSYGYKSQPRSGGGNHRVGTTSLSGATLTGQVEDIARSFMAQGFTKVVILNGHFENYQFIYEGLEVAVGRARETGADARAMLLSYWDFVGEETLEAVFPDGFLGWDIEHGGVLETSLMLLLHPSKVDMSRAVDHPPALLKPYDIFPEDPARTPASGCLSSPRGASADRGRLLLDAVVDGVASAIEAEYSLPVAVLGVK